MLVTHAIMGAVRMGMMNIFAFVVKDGRAKIAIKVRMKLALMHVCTKCD